MNDSDRFKLYFGPYKTPRFHYGKKVWCHCRGWVKIVGLSDGKIPWPIGRPMSAKPGRQAWERRAFGVSRLRSSAVMKMDPAAKALVAVTASSTVAGNQYLLDSCISGTTPEWNVGRRVRQRELRFDALAKDVSVTQGHRPAAVAG